MTQTVFEKMKTAISVLKLDFATEEFATFADDQELSEEAIAAVQTVFSYISEKKQQTTVQTLLKLSRLPKKAPKTFENFDFSLLKSRDLDRSRALPSLGAVYSHRNLAFIGPPGTGKTHLAQAFGYACCQHGMRAYFIKASELRDRFTAARRAGKTDSCLKSFDDFYAYFLKLLEATVIKEIRTRLMTIEHRAAIAPSPLLSAFMDDCVERGEEYSVGGARYHMFGTYLTGFANCVDSLAVIKKLVFEDKLYTLEQIAEVTRTNFEGNEQLRQYAMNRVPKFGNDNGYVDSIAVRLLDDFTSIIERLRTTEAKGLILGEGIATFEFFAKWGHDVGASADGRKSQEPVASNFSPAHGADAMGPTATIRSITAADLRAYMMGAPLDIEINPEDVKGEQGLNRMVALIKGFKEHGGLILTITGTNREKLLAAQREPEKYRNLRVRMGGLSAYFVTLSKEMQNSIIKRTSHSL